MTIGIETCQDLLAYYKDLENFNHGFTWTTLRKVARLRLALTDLCEMLRLMPTTLSSPNPERADVAHRCLTDSIPGLIALSAILESIRDHSLQEDWQQDEPSATHNRPYPFRDVTVESLLSQLRDVDKTLAPALRYSKPLRRDVGFRKRQVFKAASELPFDEEDSSDANELTTFAQPGSVAQAQEITFDHYEVNTADGTDPPDRVPIDSAALDATDHTFVPATRARRTIPTCYILAAFGFIIIGSSLAVAIYYTVAKDRMGDGFTAASWMTGAGTLILAAPGAIHYSRCHCWESPSDGTGGPQPLALHEERGV